jgi:hypothetical protein
MTKPRPAARTPPRSRADGCQGPTHSGRQAARSPSTLISGVGGGGGSQHAIVLTSRPFWRGAARQLILGAVAVGITYLIGLAVGGMTAGA